MHKLAQLDHRHVWHPFTQMGDWLKREPIVIVSGDGAVLRDARGKEYLDANASIWTNLHGHNHPKINAAIQKQLKKIAHSSALGLANEPASLLAQELARVTNPFTSSGRDGMLPSMKSGTAARAPSLNKVFFSDDGATAMEVALKLAYEFARRTRGIRSPKFLSLQGAYHGDTVGAMSLGHIDLFHRAYGGLAFRTDAVMSPYCYRCPFNRAKPERADAREYRKCRWECVDQVERQFKKQGKRGHPYAAMVVEPLIQGAAGMIPQPSGWLQRVAEIARANGAQLIADEVMTGFGRVGQAGPEHAMKDAKRRKGEGETRRPARLPLFPSPRLHSSLFACHHEGVQPDFIALAKGMTGGYLPLAATLTTRDVFNAFLGEYAEFKTFFHGHSFTGNQLGASAALASLELLQTPTSLRTRIKLQQTLANLLPALWLSPHVGDIRQVGLIAGVELVEDWRTRKRFDLRRRVGARVCEAMAHHGVLTRPIGDVIVLMPPYCTTDEQAARMIWALREAIHEVLAK